MELESGTSHMTVLDPIPAGRILDLQLYLNSRALNQLSLLTLF